MSSEGIVLLAHVLASAVIVLAFIEHRRAEQHGDAEE
jgi:hypothetical protein